MGLEIRQVTAAREGTTGAERQGRHGEHAHELHGERVKDDDAAPGAVPANESSVRLWR
jgi:hypothetical protein